MEKVRLAMEHALNERWAAEPPPIIDRYEPPAVRSAASMAVETSKRPKPPLPASAPPAHGVLPAQRVPVSGAILAVNRLVAAIDGDPHREAYRALHATVAARMALRNAAVLGVTGAASGQGKTLTAANLAIALARDSGRPVVLLDLDFENPSLHRLFGVEPRAGIESCLFDGAALADAWMCPSIEGLALVPARGGAPAGTLWSPGLEGFLAGVRRECEEAVLIADLPAVTNRAAAVTMQGLVDAVLLVVEDGVTKTADYRRTLACLDAEKLLGTVLNNGFAA